MNEILRLFPEKIKRAIEWKVAGNWETLQEIRFRLHQPIELIFDQHVNWINAVKPTKNDSVFLLNQLSEFSLYRIENELREGYITIEGGHRVGLAGKVNTRNGIVKAIQSVTFFNIRIAKEHIGSASDILPYVYYNKQYFNTLFIGPPQTGKTTLLRDITRLIASGWGNVLAQKVGVIDERSEIGACINGIPQHDLGIRTDIMDACPKAEGLMMMIRSMSPDVLIIDEIGSKADVKALLEAINAGVVIFCTIHGQSLAELKKRPSLQPLFQQQIFERMILLKKHSTPGLIEKIYNLNEKNIFKTRGA